MSEALDFSQRARLEEEMDGPCSYEELRRCLEHLALVNRFTLAHHHTVRWLERIPQLKGMQRQVRLLDIGCGYGDMLRRIERWAGDHGLPMQLIGADINANALRAARESTPQPSRIQWVLGDVCTAPETQDVDLVTSCGVFHHLDEDEIVRLLAWMDSTAKVGWYITDLHRKPVPYHIFGLLMRGPWWHRFIRPDGLRSIRRSFLAEDWRRMCTKAAIDVAEILIEECRPARLCVGRIKRVAAEQLITRESVDSEWQHQAS
jgi:SAM-dependent methyltransferase